jgi:hypothetical protein
MPPNRVRKQRPKTSTERRADLATRIRFLGDAMPRCSYCREHNSSCVVAEDSNRCASCVAANRRGCDWNGIADSTIRSFANEKNKLDLERAAALAEQNRVVAALGQVTAKLARLDSQTRAFQERVRKAFEREDTAIRELEAEEAAAVASLAVPSVAEELVTSLLNRPPY